MESDSNFYYKRTRSGLDSLQEPLAKRRKHSDGMYFAAKTILKLYK